MDREKLNSQRQALFARLEEEFTAELIPAKHNEAEEGRFDSLTAFFEDLTAEGNETIGEFFFLPFEDDETADMQLFVNYFTIAEDVSEEYLTDVVYAASVLNSYIPVGTFAYDAAAGSLIYRHATELTLPLSDEELSDRIDHSMGMAVDTLQRFGYLLLEVSDGERTAESVLETLLPGEE